MTELIDGQEPTQEALAAAEAARLAELATSEARTVPIEALQAERGRAAELQAKLDAIEEEKRTKAEAEAIARGEHEAVIVARDAEIVTLRETLTGLEQREEARRVAQAERQEVRKDALPDNLKALLPAGLEADAMDDWLTRAEATVSASTTTAAGGASSARSHGGGGDPDDLTPEQQAWAETQRFQDGVSAATIRKAFNSFGPGRTAAAS